MAAATIGFLPGAIADARAARKYYREIDCELERDFVARLDHALATIQERPLAWPQAAHGTRRYLMQRFPLQSCICSRART
jgi:hypothetical protein